MDTYRTVYSWNTWGGSVPGVVETILEASRDALCICLQECHHTLDLRVPERIMPKDPGSRQLPLNPRLYGEIEHALGPSFQGFFAPALQGALHDTERADWPSIFYGNAVFVRREALGGYNEDIVAGRKNELFDAKEGRPAAKTAQQVILRINDALVSVVNAHGAWFQSNKGDLPWRFRQAAKWLDLLSTAKHLRPTHHLLIGDLNLVSDTAVLRELVASPVFGSDGGEHLNQVFGITDTRTKLYTKAIREADHAIASPSLRATLRVKEDVPSDHALLACELFARQ